MNGKTPHLLAASESERGQEEDPGCCPAGLRMGAPQHLHHRRRPCSRVHSPPLPLRVQPVLLHSAVRPDDGRGGRQGKRLPDRDAVLRPIPGGRSSAGAAAPMPPWPRRWARRALAYLALAVTLLYHCFIMYASSFWIFLAVDPGHIFARIFYAVVICALVMCDLLGCLALLLGGDGWRKPQAARSMLVQLAARV